MVAEIPPEQKAAIHAVVRAIENRDTDIYVAVRLAVTSPLSDDGVEDILAILRHVGYQRGMPAGGVIARMYDAFGAAERGMVWEPPYVYRDDRY
ncbi:hypothetical protein [Nocardia terpenica]|uniref:Uncharacterized protein n=1 Tax=Nocardia terpenica TaxID=455432 RepID=A0A6G9Z9P6_9NOCA|nr:hypothetical protein [Nocardia terpenica]QIS22121.1 hypothetical protein F6W96_31020 [Nocardia terpenica]